MGVSILQTSRNVHVKYVGSDTALVVPFGSLSAMVASFEVAHKAQYHFRLISSLS